MNWFLNSKKVIIIWIASFLFLILGFGLNKNNFFERDILAQNQSQTFLNCNFDGTLNCNNTFPLQLTVHSFSSSLFNKAVCVYSQNPADSTTALAYPTEGFLDHNEGSIEFLIAPKFDMVSQQGNDQVLFQLYKNQSNRLNLVLRNGIKFELTFNNKTIQSGDYGWRKGRWHFLALTYGSKGARFFIDGNLVMEIKELVDGFSELPDRFYLGSRFTGSYKANFYFDELKVYPYERTHHQIALEMKKIHYSRFIYGSVSVNILKQAPAGEYGILVINYTLDRNLPYPQGAVRFIAKHANDWPLWQTANPKERNYATMKAVSSTGKSYEIEFGCNASPDGTSAKYCEIRPKKETFSKGTTISLFLGGTSGSGPGVRLPRWAIKTPINILVDDGSGYFFENKPLALIDIKAGTAVNLMARGRSQIKVGEEYKLNVWAEDKLRNVSKDFIGTVSLITNDSQDILPSPHNFTANDKGKFLFKGIYFKNPGIKLIKITSNIGEFYSNPIEVVENYADEGQIFWGDIHGHTEFSDGNGSLEDYFTFARDYTFLDFAAVSDHNPHPGSKNIHPQFHRNYFDEDNWQKTIGVVKNFYQPGNFVSILGQEASYGDAFKIGPCLDAKDCRDAYSSPSDPLTGLPSWGSLPNWPCYQKPQCVNVYCPEMEGDWHLYFNHDNPPIFAPDTVEELFAQVSDWKKTQANNFPVFIMASHGGRQALMDLLSLPIIKDDPDLVPVGEIISNHISSPCSFETWIQNGLERTKLGIMASSDDHTGSPGRSVQGSGQGSIAIYAPELTREAVFEAIRKRHIYAHSYGDRAIAEFFIEVGGRKLFMGETGKVYEGETPKINFKIISRSGIKKIDLIKNGKVIYSSERNSSGLVSETFSYIDNNFNNNSYYYVRVLHQNWATTWTSPVWLDKSSVEETNAQKNLDDLMDLMNNFYKQFPEDKDCNNDEKINSLDYGIWRQRYLSN